MKKIEAYIKSRRLNETIERLHAIDGLTGVTVIDIKGFGRERDTGAGPVRIVDNPIGAVPHVKIETVCSDAVVEAVIAAIAGGAHTGLRSDGKIYVLPVEDAVRISTGERGEGAV